MAIAEAPGNFFPGYRDISALSQEQLARIEQGNRAHRLGRKSEIKAASALEGLKVNGERVIESVTRNEWGGEEDAMGHDLTLETVIGPVWVQVKSSEEGMEDFMAQEGERLSKLGIKMSVRESFARRRLVLLNGNRSRDDIARNFLLQFKKIQRVVAQVA